MINGRAAGRRHGLSRRTPGRPSADPVLVDWLLLAARSSGPERRNHRAPTEPPIRVLLVEALGVVRLGLVALFGTVRSCEVIAEASSPAEAVSMAGTHLPDVVILDADPVGGAAIDACRQIRSEHPEVRVLMFASRAEAEVIVASIRAGANAFVLKRADAVRLVEAVEAVDAGSVVLDPALTHEVTGWVNGQRDAALPLERLSDQERKILRLIAEGMTNRQIAVAIALSDHTVRTYVSNLLKKLRLTSRSEAAALLVRHEVNHDR
jgi:two-component system response regulator DevR